MPIHPHQPRPLEQAGPEGSKPEGHFTGSSKNHQSCLWSSRLAYFWKFMVLIAWNARWSQLSVPKNLMSYHFSTPCLRRAYALQVLAYAVAFFDNGLREAYATWGGPFLTAVPQRELTRRPFLVIHAEFSSDSDLKKKTMKMNQTKQTQVGGRAEKVREPAQWAEGQISNVCLRKPYAKLTRSLRENLNLSLLLRNL